MKASAFLLSGLCVVGSCGASVALAGRQLVLVDSSFNNVSVSRVAAYPPSPGGKFREIAPGFSGWSVGGQIQLTQAQGYGVDGSGGVFFEVLKEGKFYQVSFQKLALPMLSPGRVIREPLQSIEFSVDAKIPAGREVIVYLSVDVPKEVSTDNAWSKRLVLGTLTGSDAFKRYTFSGAEVPEETLNIFINFIRDMQLNGMQDTVCGLVFHMHPEGWSAGDGWLMDNVKFTVAGD